MKKRFLDYSLNLIMKYDYQIDEIKKDELRYGLEGIYLSFTKLIIILFISFFLKITSEMLTMLLFFNILRLTGFGLHATKSWICLVSSAVIFILFPSLSKDIFISFEFKIILGIISIILIYLYAPADTKKKPLVNEKKRKIYKFITTINCLILVIIAISIKSNIISNLIFFGIYSEILMILPISYKMFNLTYNNYKTYLT
ncbi:MAG: accessory gene regulator B family protein [Bacilli bacterium]|nr:accessory gene regulator B family protein [Bacilli bacterium]